MDPKINNHVDLISGFINIRAICKTSYLINRMTNLNRLLIEHFYMIYIFINLLSIDDNIITRSF